MATGLFEGAVAGFGSSVQVECDAPLRSPVTIASLPPDAPCFHPAQPAQTWPATCLPWLLAVRHRMHAAIDEPRALRGAVGALGGAFLLGAAPQARAARP